MTRSADQYDVRRRKALEILRHNRGFRAPERWIDYALDHNFHRVPTRSQRTCPQCGTNPERVVGRYVYYSNQASLLECGACGLIWSDLRLPPGVVASHFETAYKSERYFAKRRPVFEQVASLVDRHAPPRGRVLDVGGARGHLTPAVRERRPDLDVTVHDLSFEACAAARRQFGIRTIQGSVADLTAVEERFDVLVLCDVIYFEPDLHALWDVIGKLTAPGGTVVIRVPNRRALIELGQRLRGLAPDFVRRRTRWRGRVPWFNPEHLFVFTRSFLVERLREVGFDEVRALPARPSGRGLLRRLVYMVAGAVHRLTGGAMVATPSMLLVATGRPH